MILKQTWVSAADNTNVRWLRTFHLYKGSFRHKTEIGGFIKGSVRVVEPPRLEYKGFKFKFNKKGNICRMLLIRGSYPTLRLDGGTSIFWVNSGILIKKKQNPKSKYLQGPTTYNLRRKKFKSLYKTIL